MDEFRIEIWDIVYRARGPKTIDELSQIVNQDNETVRAAVDHHWFDVVEGMVSIAVARHDAMK